MYSATSSARATPVYVAPQALSDDDLARELARLRSENTTLESQYKNAEELHRSLVTKAVKLKQTTELEEEAIANNLLKRMDMAKREMKNLKQHIRHEEENHTTLRKQIDNVHQQQITMENLLEQEQEFILNKLQRQLIETTNKKAEMEKQLAGERCEYLQLLHGQLECLMAAQRGGGSDRHRRTVSGDTTERNQGTVANSSLSSSTIDAEASTSIVTSQSTPSKHRMSMRTPDRTRAIADLEEEINALLVAQLQYQRDLMSREQQCTVLTERLEELQRSTFLDRARAEKLRDDLGRAKLELEFMQKNAMSGSRRTPSMPSGREEGGGGASTPAHQSLRDRTKELLSTPRIVPMVSRRERGDSLTASEHRSLSPSLHSGYNSGVEYPATTVPIRLSREAVAARQMATTEGEAQLRMRNLSTASRTSSLFDASAQLHCPPLGHGNDCGDSPLAQER